MDYAMPLPHFRGMFLASLSLIHDTMEVFMDDFTSHGENFSKALNNLDKVLTRCKEVNLCLSSEKCRMMLTQGMVLGHLLSLNGIKVDPTKIQVILNLPVPCTQKEVRSFI